MFSWQKASLSQLDLTRAHVEVCGYNLIGEYKSGMLKALCRKKAVCPLDHDCVRKGAGGAGIDSVLSDNTN